MEVNNLTMEDKENIIEEVHLYTEKREAMIKIASWIVSWIGGILVLFGTEDKAILGSAYFIYSLSLLMEFVPKIYKKVKFINKLIHTIFCFSILIVFLLSMAILLGVILSNRLYMVMFGITICIVAYMIIDMFFLWLQKEKLKMNSVDIGISKKMHDEQVKFKETLTNGYLGSINKGEDINE